MGNKDASSNFPTQIKIKLELWDKEWIPTPEEIDSLKELYKRLTGKEDVPVDFNQRFFTTIRGERTTLVMARDMEKDIVVGMGMIHSWTTLSSGVRGFIDDVVVLPEYRGRSIGENIVKTLLTITERDNISRVRLTSNPHNIQRRTAIRLYKKLGFKKINTNLFEYVPKK